jgi:hypothetical protein
MIYYKQLLNLNYAQKQERTYEGNKHAETISFQKSFSAETERLTSQIDCLLQPTTQLQKKPSLFIQSKFALKTAKKG